MLIRNEMIVNRHPWIRVASSGKEVISAEQAEDLRMKEKRKREREVKSFHQFCYAYDFFCYTYKIQIGLHVCVAMYLLDECLWCRNICLERSVESWKQLERWRRRRMTNK